MQRLTAKLKDGTLIYVQSADCFKTDDEGNFIIDKGSIIHTGKHIDKLSQYEDLEEEFGDIIQDLRDLKGDKIQVL